MVKSVGNGTTFPKNLTTAEQVRGGVAVLADSVATRLRHSGLYAGGVQVTVRDPQFHDRSRQMQLSAPTHLIRELTAAAMDLTGQLWKPPAPVRALTVTAIHLVRSEDAYEQVDLFTAGAAPKKEKQEKLEAAMDRLRGKFGTDVISYGAAVQRKRRIPCHDNRRGKTAAPGYDPRLSAQLPFRYREAADRAIARHLLALPEYRSAEAVFCFVSAGREIDTRPILEQTLADGKMLCVPLCVADGIMELRAIRDLKELFPGAYGILEPPADSPALSPDQIDLAVIPCVTCSREGRRLGRGGGYYDRFLAHYRGAAVLLCRERLLRQEIPFGVHDYPIPWVLTEAGLFEDGTPSRLE